jgi:hypothetical protein
MSGQQEVSLSTINPGTCAQLSRILLYLGPECIRLLQAKPSHPSVGLVMFCFCVGIVSLGTEARTQFILVQDEDDEGAVESSSSEEEVAELGQGGVQVEGAGGVARKRARTRSKTKSTKGLLSMFQATVRASVH